MEENKLEELVSLTEQLMRFRSTNENLEGLKGCADFINEYFVDSGLTIQRHFKERVPSLVVTKNSTKTPKVFLVGHFDVLAGKDEQFKPRRDDGRLHGRGALDMKSGVAVIMQIIKDLATTNHDVGLMLTGDEERGGAHGVGHLIEDGYSSKVAIIPDGGLDVNRIVQKEKGLLWFTLVAKGKRAHSAYPWRGENAARKLTAVIDKVASLFHPLTEHPEDHWVTTAVLTRLNAGIASNMVPDHARATFDVRYVETDDPNEIMNRVKSVLPDGIELEHEITVVNTNTPLDHFMVKPFLETLKAIGKEPEFILAQASSDARYFAAKNIPSIISQPRGYGHHSHDEWVDMSSIGEYYEVLREYLDRTALS